MTERLTRRTLIRYGMAATGAPLVPSWPAVLTAEDAGSDVRFDVRAFGAMVVMPPLLSDAVKPSGGRAV